MKLDKLVGERFKERPADCVIESHALMMRGGYIKQVSNGIYSSFANLRRVTRKIENIIREEMDALDGQEVVFPVVMPASLWQETGRYDDIGNELLRFTDRNDTQMLLGMTHEEAAVHLAREYGNTYAKYPFMIYQIQTKFRDEARPRGGLIRTREFTMKDAYSYHTSQEDLEVYYEKGHKAYERIFTRVGLSVVSVASDSGMMGGKVSHEFMLLTPVGEDSIVICGSCDYRANLEAANIGVTNTDVSNTEATNTESTSTESTNNEATHTESTNNEATETTGAATITASCPQCGQPSLSISRGIEVGNIFQLGDKYSKSMEMKYVDPSGALQYPVMGCYGIGVGRLAASICEAHHDDYGPIWPMAVAPWQVHLCCVKSQDSEAKEYADGLYLQLKGLGIEVIYDDRQVSPGVMFSDADLLGVPVRVVVSPRNMKEACCEIVTRDKTLKDMVKLDEVAAYVQGLIGKMMGS